MGGVHPHVRIPFPYLWNRWAHCAEIKWVVSDQVAVRFIQVISWTVAVVYFGVCHDAMTSCHTP